MSFSKDSRVKVELASMSFIRDSTLIGASALAERTFLRRSQPVVSRKTALGDERTSILYLVLNSSAKC